MAAIDDIKQLNVKYDYLAPDLSEIRLLVEGQTGSLAHCRLPSGATTKPVRHKTVEELWYVLAGRGRIWRATPFGERVDEIEAGASFRIAKGTSFQFSASATDDLVVMIATIPKWPGETEAEHVEGPWAFTAPK